MLIPLLLAMLLVMALVVAVARAGTGSTVAAPTTVEAARAAHPAGAVAVPASSPAPPPHAPVRLAPAQPARSQVLFASAGRRSIGLDAVLLEPYGEDHPAARPFHLRLRTPETPMISELASSVLTEWADDGETVDVTFTRSVRGPRARVSDGTVTLTLDLLESSLA